jgi:peptide/nickel transport system substrate-binding protein
MFKKIFLAWTPRERLIFWIASGVIFISFTALAGATLQKSTTVVPAKGGEYVEGVLGQPTSINPVLASSNADKILVRLLFANLASLAEKIEPEESGRIWRLRLKEDLRWSDGTQLTSDDVIFTIEQIQNPETRSPLFRSWQGVAANRLSELEIQFNLVAPYPFFTSNLEELYILPKHLFADTPSVNWRLSEYNLKPVGNGPYKYEKHSLSPKGFIESYSLIENPAYVGGAPLIQKFKVQFFSNAQDLLRAFNTGEISGFANAVPEAASKINRPYQSFSFRLPGYYAVFWNQSQNLALKERVVRQALSLAIKRKELAGIIFGGQAIALDGPIPLEEPEEKSPQEVSLMLEEAGWKLGEGGVREKSVKSGKIPLEFTLTLPDVPFLVKTAEELKNAWEKIGARVNLSPVAAQGITEEQIKKREYQALLFGNILNPPGDLYPFWHSNERFYPGLNLSLYSRREADTLMEDIRRELDPGVREKKLGELNALIKNDYPAAFLYSPNYEMIAGKDLHGVETGVIADPADRFRSVNRWYLKTARALK